MCGRSRAPATTTRRTGHADLRSAFARKELHDMTSRLGFRSGLLAAMVALSLVAGACHKKQPPIARPLPPPPPAPTEPARPPAPPEPANAGATTPVAPPEDAIASASLDDLNRNSPLKPVFYSLDNADVDQAGQQALQSNADVLKKYTTWQVTIEGHCDERGTAEYNLALGERRPHVSAVARRVCRSDQDRELRQGVPIRSRPRRGGLVEESPRALRGDRQVGRLSEYG